jgi:DNA-binding MarR family transcriptional regulator
MSELDSLPGHLIRRLHQKSVAIFSVSAAHLDITQVQFAALIALDENPGVDQVKLSMLVALDKATTGDVVSRLVKKGLVRRGVKATDRRSFELHLTEEGIRILEELRSLTRGVQKKLLSPLSKAESETLMKLIGKVVFELKD